MSAAPDHSSHNAFIKRLAKHRAYIAASICRQYPDICQTMIDMEIAENRQKYELQPETCQLYGCPA